MERGDKFSVSATLDVEILGYYPAGEQRDGKAKYVCSINGYKMTTDVSFLEMLKEIKPIEEVKEVKKKGGRKNERK